jgi:uncharacterized protein (DUF1778 family)
MPKMPKETRLNLRVSLHEKAVIAKAAAIKRTTTSKFILQNAYVVASEVISEQANFALPDKQWKKFCQALDAPTRSIPALKKLLKEPGVFDEQ